MGVQIVDWRELLRPVKGGGSGSGECRLWLRGEDGRPVASDIVMQRSVVTTGLQKAVRRGDWRRAALYAWILSQCDSWYFWRRMRIIALEDLTLPFAFAAMYGMAREYDAECEPYKKRGEPCVSWDGIRIAVAAAVWLSDGAPCGPRKDRRADSFMELVNEAGLLFRRKGVETEAWKMVRELAIVPEEWLDVHVKKRKGERSWVLEGSRVEGLVDERYAEWLPEWRRMIEEVYRNKGTW